MAAIDPKLLEVLGPYKDYFEPQEDGKLKCLVNGHCFPSSRPEQIAAFVNGARFAKLKVRYDAENALTKYEPFVVVSKNFPTMLYCALTGQLLEKSLAAVKKHMGGKRFVRAKARFVADQQDLKPEPELSEFGIVMPGEEGESKGKKQRKKAGEEGKEGEEGEDEDEQMAEAEGSDDEPEFWRPPGEGDSSGEEGEEEEEEGEGEGEEGAGGSGSDEEGAAADAMDEDGAEGDQGQAGPSGRGATGKAAAPAAKQGGKKAANGGAVTGAEQPAPKQPQPQQQQQQAAKGKAQQQQHQTKKDKPNAGQPGKPQQDQQPQQQPAGRKEGKLNKKQKKKLAAAQQAEAAPDDFDFDAEANDDVAAAAPAATAAAPNGGAAKRPQAPKDLTAAAQGKQAKKKNVNRPSPAKKPRH